MTLMRGNIVKLFADFDKNQRERLKYEIISWKQYGGI